MKERTLETKIKECSPEELSADDRELVEAAKEMTRTSYVPYSKFHVGAAIRMADGSIVKGSNQENAAYPSGTCAERTACFYASASKPGMAMKKIAIAAWTRLRMPDEAPYESCFQAEPISPCGACRQVMAELMRPDAPVIMADGVSYRIMRVCELLPYAFDKEDLNGI